MNHIEQSGNRGLRQGDNNKNGPLTRRTGMKLTTHEPQR